MQSPALKRRLLALAATSALVAAAGCSAGRSAGGTGAVDGVDPEAVGTVSLAYSLPGGEHLSTVSYTLTNGAQVYVGDVNIADASTISFDVAPVVPGSGYIVILHAVSDDGTVDCSGQSTDVVVVSHVATIVDVQLVCLRDGGPVDAGARDAASSDAGLPPPDASADVASPPDTGTGGQDAGPVDSGGGIDTGVSDASDGAAEDSGEPRDAPEDSVTTFDAGADGGEEDAAQDSGEMTAEASTGGADAEAGSSASDATTDAEEDAGEDAGEDAPEDAEEFPLDGHADGSLFRCPRHHGWKYIGCSVSSGRARSDAWTLAACLVVVAALLRRRARSGERVSTPRRTRKVSAQPLPERGKALTMRPATVGERLMSARKEQLVGRVALLALAACCVAACNLHEDPSVVDNGPTFVVAGKSSEQPPLVSQGISMYVEARGGNYVGLITHGCGHTLAGLKNVAASCGVLPDATDPMYFLVNPAPGHACTVEARLYFVCDDAGMLPLGLSGIDQFEWCDTVGSLMGSVEVPVLQPLDASADGSAYVDDITDASAPTADVGDVRMGPPL